MDTKWSVKHTTSIRQLWRTQGYLFTGVVKIKRFLLQRPLFFQASFTSSVRLKNVKRSWESKRIEFHRYVFENASRKDKQQKSFHWILHPYIPNKIKKIEKNKIDILKFLKISAITLNKSNFLRSSNKLLIIRIHLLFIYYNYYY